MNGCETCVVVKFWCVHKLISLLFLFTIHSLFCIHRNFLLLLTFTQYVQISLMFSMYRNLVQHGKCNAHSFNVENRKYCLIVKSDKLRFIFINLAQNILYYFLRIAIQNQRKVVQL